jgi:glycosyltransferase involved in cell wall biosynthesis
VVYNARDPRRFPGVDKEPFVFSAGRVWDEAKNIAALQRIAPALAWPVLVAGDASHPEGGTQPVSNVTHLGRLDAEAIADWYARAAIYCLPARYEPFGLSALEAALAGCALVLSDIPSLREVWGQAALFVPADDPDALLAALRELVDHPLRRAAFATRARSRALTYSPGHQAACYRVLYRELCGSRTALAG